MTRPLVLIPTYEHPEFTARVLDSLSQTVVHGRDARILVADDGSQQPPAPHPNSELRRYDQNAGFVEHVNRVVRDEWRDGPLWLLNYDTSFHLAPPDWFAWMNEVLEARYQSDHAGILGPLLNWGMFQQVPWLFEDGQPRVACRGDQSWPGQVAVPVSVLCGFCMVLHPAFVRQRLERCGWLLNPTFSRVSYDDFDLSLWARQQGWTLWVHQGVVVWHEKDRADRAGAPNAEGKRRLEQQWGADVLARVDVNWRLGTKLRYPQPALPRSWQ